MHIEDLGEVVCRMVAFEVYTFPVVQRIPRLADRKEHGEGFGSVQERGNLRREDTVEIFCGGVLRYDGRYSQLESRISANIVCAYLNQVAQGGHYPLPVVRHSTHSRIP